MRALLFGLLIAGCTVPCKEGTVFLSYRLTGVAASADFVDVTLAIDGGAAQTRTLSRTGSDATVEVDFAHYPKGKSLTFTVTARSGTEIVAAAAKTITAEPGCTSLTLTLDPTTADLSVAADLAQPDQSLDLAEADLVTADLTSADFAEAPDAAEDMTTVDPSTGTVILADVSGTFWVDAGVAYGNPGPAYVTHTLAATAAFPVSTQLPQHVSGTQLNGCVWERSDISNGVFMVPDESAGTVTMSGYDTSSAAVAFRLPALMQGPMPNLGIDCIYSGPAPYLCRLNSASGTIPVEQFVFPELQRPSPSPAANSNLLGSTITHDFAHSGSSSFSENRTANLLPPLPQPPYVVAIDGAPGNHSLEDLAGKLGGGQAVTIDYSCDGNPVKGSGCPATGQITVLAIQTSLGRKWESFGGSNWQRYGELRCFDADVGASPHNFVLTQQMIQDILGLTAAPPESVKQTLKVLLFRMKVSPTSSGAHQLFMGAGRGRFAFVDQP